jgi:hypothetical protein
METQIIGTNPENLKIFLEFDGHESLLKAMTAIENIQEHELKIYDEWNAQAASTNIHVLLFIYNSGVQLNTRFAAFFTYAFLYHFFNYKKIKFDADSYFYLLKASWTDKQHPNAELLQLILDALETLFQFSMDEDDNGNAVVASRMGNLHYLVALELESLGEFESAIANNHTAITFMQLAQSDAAISMCFHIIELARKAGHQNLMPNLFQLAALLSNLSRIDKAKKIEVFDAAENLVRYILIKKQVENFDYIDDDLYKVETFLKENIFLQPLLPLFYLGLGLVEKGENDPDFAALYTGIWDASVEDWFSNIFQGSKSLIIEIANKRFELLPKSKKIEVFWSNWSIEYGRMLHSIPHNQSFLKEEYRNEILLDLKHELIHVYSLFGSVGTTLNIMRWLLIDLELLLFGSQYDINTEGAKSIWENIMKSNLPVQLSNPDLITLSYAERSIAIECKIKSIEHIWAPWFEGIAVFGETTDDPALDKDFESSPSSVMHNLVEFNSQDENLKDKSPLDAVKDHVRKMENLYTEALKTEGVYKLMAYLTSHHKKYLPGYFCVRSILSSWRKTYDKPIRGDQAFRLLLHLTRFSRYDILPDLSLPPEAFKKATIQRFLNWVQSIAHMDKDVLKSFFDLDASQTSHFSSWMNGKLVIHNDDRDLQQAQQLQSEKAKECLSSLTGDRTDLDELEGANFVLTEIIKAIAEASKERIQKPGILNDKTAGYILSRYTILPLAVSESPFWLLSNNRSIACLIRTRVHDIEHGNPSYNLVSFKISQADFDFLKKRIQLTGRQYLRLTRAVFLGGATDTTLSHRHFFVYQYDDWMHVESAGLLWLTDVSEEIKGYLQDRFKFNPVVNYKEILNGPNNPCAQRTKAWIEQNDWESVELNNAFINGKPWSDHVSMLCNEVLSPDVSDIDLVSLEILKFILKDQAKAEFLFHNGLSFFNKYDPQIIGQFIEFLFESGTLPQQTNPQLEELNRITNELFGSLLKKDKTTFDFTNI